MIHGRWPAMPAVAALLLRLIGSRRNLAAVADWAGVSAL
jgi:hypothetical protein